MFHDWEHAYSAATGTWYHDHILQTIHVRHEKQDDDNDDDDDKIVYFIVC